MNETPGSINDDIKQIVLEFEDHPSSAWLAFSNLGSWEQREKVVELFDLEQCHPKIGNPSERRGHDPLLRKLR